MNHLCLKVPKWWMCSLSGAYKQILKVHRLESDFLKTPNTWRPFTKRAKNRDQHVCLVSQPRPQPPVCQEKKGIVSGGGTLEETWHMLNCYLVAGRAQQSSREGKLSQKA